MENQGIVKKSKGSIPTDVPFLLLEDMDNIRQQMVNDLRTLGVTAVIHEAPNIQTAIKLCSTQQIGFVISDWNLPDGIGLDFLKKFRAVERFSKTPFMMCTTNSEVKYFLDAIASGANDFLVKPWTIDELQKKLSQVWELYLKKNSK